MLYALVHSSLPKLFFATQVYFTAGSYGYAVCYEITTKTTTTTTTTTTNTSTTTSTMKRPITYANKTN